MEPGSPKSWASALTTEPSFPSLPLPSLSKTWVCIDQNLNPGLLWGRHKNSTTELPVLFLRTGKAFELLVISRIQRAPRRMRRWWGALQGRTAFFPASFFLCFPAFRKIKSLGEDDPWLDDTAAWIERSRKLQVEKELAEKRVSIVLESQELLGCMGASLGTLALCVTCTQLPLSSIQ